MALIYPSSTIHDISTIWMPYMISSSWKLIHKLCQHVRSLWLSIRNQIQTNGTLPQLQKSLVCHFLFFYTVRENTIQTQGTKQQTAHHHHFSWPNSKNSKLHTPLSQLSLASWTRIWLNLISRLSTKPITRWRTRSGQHLRTGGLVLSLVGSPVWVRKMLLSSGYGSRANQPLRSHGLCCLLGGIEKQALPLCVTHMCTRGCTIARAMKTKVRSRLWKG